MLRGLIVPALLAACLAAGMGAPGDAQSNPLSRLVGDRAEERAALWYLRDDGRGRFIFDRTVRPALIWEEGAREVIAVTASPASGGGEVWRTDTGRTLMRVSRLGGATYFPDDARDGVIVESVGRAQTLVPPPITGDELRRQAERMVDALAAMRRGGGAVTVEIAAPARGRAHSASHNAYIADAMAMIVRGADAAPRGAIRNLEEIYIGIGEAPAARFNGRMLDITLSLEDGYGGRPSSRYIERTLEGGR